MIRIFPLLLILLIVSVIAIFILNRPAQTQHFAARAYGKALIGGDFSLTDTHGSTFTNKDFQGRALLVYMGYSHCPDICPATLATMGQALKLLGSDQTKAAFVFITLDPERDTPAVLARFLAAFDPRILGLTGNPQAVDQAAKAYKVFYAKVTPNASGNYPISHSGFLYLMDRQGNYVTHFEPGVSAQEIAQAIRQVMQR